MLGIGAAALALALISAFVGFREGSPSVTVAAKILCLLFGVAFVVLSGLGFVAVRKPR